MRILQVIQFFSPKHGGSFAVAYELTKHLSNLGHKVTVITTDFELDNNFTKYFDGVEVIQFHCQYNIGGFLISSSMKKYLRENIGRFDIIHMHNFRTYQNVIVHRYAKKNNVPYILQAHGSIPRIMGKKSLKYAYDMFYGNKLLKDASKVIAVSNLEVNHYVKMNVSTEKVITIPNGIDVDSFIDIPKKGSFREKYNIAEKHIVLYLGRLHEIKGIDFLIRTYSELIQEKKDVILIFAGPDDGYLHKAQSLVKELKLENNVKFIGLVNGLEKYAAYVDADVLIYPSIFEIFGLVPFEAIMCGTPVIVTDNCGCGRLIEESRMGYLVEYGDLHSLKEKIIGILEDSQQSSVFIDNGKNFISKKLSWETVVKNIEGSYENCIHNI
jgi:glycosyltransferase involved in cell wall biosynthesis